MDTCTYITARQAKPTKASHYMILSFQTNGTTNVRDWKLNSFCWCYDRHWQQHSQSEINLGRYKSWTGSARIAHLRSSEKWFSRPKLFNVCTHFTNLSLKVRARVISWDLIIFLRWSGVSDPSWSKLIQSDFCTYLMNPLPEHVI